MRESARARLSRAAATTTGAAGGRAPADLTARASRRLESRGRPRACGRRRGCTRARSCTWRAGVDVTSATTAPQRLHAYSIPHGSWSVDTWSPRSGSAAPASEKRSAAAARWPSLERTAGRADAEVERDDHPRRFEPGGRRAKPSGPASGARRNRRSSWPIRPAQPRDTPAARLRPLRRRGVPTAAPRLTAPGSIREQWNDLVHVGGRVSAATDGAPATIVTWPSQHDVGPPSWLWASS